MAELNIKDVEAIASTPLGRSMRKFFPFDESYMHLNNGTLPFPSPYIVPDDHSVVLLAIAFTTYS